MKVKYKEHFVTNMKPKAERKNRKGPWTQEGGGYVLLKIVNQIRLIQLQPCWKSQLKTCS